MKKTLLAFLLPLVIGSCAWAQTLDPALNFANSITEKDLFRHLKVIAADSMEGRDTGSKGQKMAADYISKHFESLGLLPPVTTPNGKSYLQEYRMAKRTWDASTTIKVGKESFAFGKDFYPIRFPAKSEDIKDLTLDVVSIDGENLEDLGKIDFKGKAVVFLEKKMDNNKKVANRAKELGAKAVFVVKSLKPIAFVEALESYAYYYEGAQTGLVSKKDEAIFYISPKLATQLFNGKNLSESLQRVGKTTHHKINIQGAYKEKIEFVSENVLGFLEGTDKKDEIVVITAHYDHVGTTDGKVYNGADDDGSGTVSVMEIAEAFSKAAQEGSRPRRSILFMTVSGEEKGLFGSQYYADYDPIFPLEKTVVDLNIDMVGRLGGDYIAKNEPNYIYLIGSDKLSSELHELSEAANKKRDNLILDYKYNDEKDPNRFYYRSDHYNFAKNNVPIIFYFNGTHPDYHQPTDDIEKINFPKMTKIARLVFYTAWEIANRENRLKVDKK